MAAAGIAVGALAGGSVAVASAVSPAHSPVTATPTIRASAWRGDGCGAKAKMWTVPKPVADYLGLSQAQVSSELHSGKSLADVAKAQGKPVSGLKNTILATVTSQVNASSKLSAAQKTKVIDEVKSHLGAIVNTTCKHGMGSH
ncbi:MAG TPA: hypothetical protein VMA72_29295 [Streptosporangiaceae bacterium]|nr:hypothetical protein [Streptosporangiaceae bacterium]